jgi:NTP pyrophosphatase (non-canonical NTP hydrolase)
MSNSTNTDVFIFEALALLRDEAKPTLEAFSTEDPRDHIARYGLCLVLEAAELVNSLPWKRWAKHPPDIEKSKEEFADLLCFIGSLVGLFETLGVSVVDLTEAYLTKIEENRERFAVYHEETK